MTNNNGYIPSKDFKLNIPKIHTVSYFNEAEWNKGLTPQEIEQREIINASYQNFSDNEERGYGPSSASRKLKMQLVAAEHRQSIIEEREEERRRNNLCLEDGCPNSPAMDDLCSIHIRKRNENAYLVKQSVDFAASLTIPGYSVAKTVVGAVSWAAGNNSGKEIVKDEFGGELSKKAGEFVADGQISSELGGKIGGYAYSAMGLVGSVVNWQTHQSHVKEGINYQRGCPVCD